MLTLAATVISRFIGRAREFCNLCRSQSVFCSTKLHGMKLTIVVVLFCLLARQANSAAPGLRIAITEKGLDYIHEVGIPILEKAISSASIPDINGNFDAPVIGGISYSLSSIHLSNLQITSSSITPTTSGVTLQISGLSINGNANWHYRQRGWPHISDSGSVDISVGSVSITISVTLGDNNGHPTLKSTACSLDIGKLSVNFHGGASWLYNLFNGDIANALKDSLKSQLCKAATDAIDTDGNKALETLPVSAKIDSTAEINYELIDSPVFSATYVTLDMKGEFLSIAHPVECPCSPSPLPPITDSSKMVFVWLTDYVANSAAYVYQTSGLLKYTVTPDMVPKNIPIQLNTSSFRAFIPQLYQKYPNMLMQLTLSAIKPPQTQITPSAINVTINSSVDVQILLPNKTIQDAFVLGLTVYASVDVGVYVSGSHQFINGTAKLLKFDFSLMSTNIGTFTVSTLQTAVNLLVNLVVIPKLNKFAEAGLEIPMVDGVSFQSPTLTLGQGFVQISSDVSYKPSLY